MSIKLAALAVAMLALAPRAEAEPVVSPTWQLSAEGDALRLGLGSLSFHVMARPASLPRLRFGLGRVGGALPSLFHKLFDPNDGWTVTEQGLVGQTFFHARETGSTWFVGGYVRAERWEWRRDDVMGSVHGTQVFVMPAAGYRWFPTRTGVFVTPWVGLGVSAWNSGGGTLGDHTYEPLRVFPIAAIHLGYEG